MLLWAIEAALLGYLGGAAFESEPLIGLAVGWAGALAVTGVAVLIQRLVSPAEPRHRVAKSGTESAQHDRRPADQGSGD